MTGKTRVLKRCVLRLLVLGSLTAACNATELHRAASEASHEHDDEAEANKSGESTTVQVDPSLLQSGRIAVSEVVQLAPGTRTTLPGEVVSAPDGEAEVGALVSGRVSALQAAEGDRVEKGQVLAFMESPEVGAVRADLVRAQAQVQAATRRLERQRTLQDQGATSQSAFDDAETMLQTATADKHAAQARLSAIGLSNDGSVTGRIALRSPIAGIITERRAVLGGAVFTDRFLFRVIAPERLRVHAHWSETQGRPPAPGTAALLLPRQQQGGAAPCKAEVAGQLGIIADETRSVILRLLPTGHCDLLTPGGYLDVVLTQEPSTEAATGPRSFQVPLEALVDVRGVPTVFVATGTPGQFVARSVLPGKSFGANAVIEAGLEAGNNVASRGVLLLKGELLHDLLGGH